MAVTEFEFSVVVPTLNNCSTIGQCVSSVKKALLSDNAEIIIADSGSSDNTVGIARELGARIVFANKGVSAGRNAGIKAAAGKIIVLVDSDCFVKKNHFVLLKKFFSENEGIVGGSYNNLPENRVSFVWKKLFEAVHHQKTQIIGKNAVYRMHGGNLAMKGKLALFDESINWGAEDREFFLSVALNNIPICFVPWLVVNHKVNESVSSIARKRLLLTSGELFSISKHRVFRDVLRYAFFAFVPLFPFALSLASSLSILNSFILFFSFFLFFALAFFIRIRGISFPEFFAFFSFNAFLLVFSTYFALGKRIVFGRWF